MNNVQYFHILSVSKSKHNHVPRKHKQTAIVQIQVLFIVTIWIAWNQGV